MLNLFKRKSPECWIIKQIDDDLLHLCGRGKATAKGRAKAVEEALHQGSYEGPVALDNSPLVLNSRLFAALVPITALRVDDEERAHWQGRIWHVSWVPQRCWAYEGPLTTQPTTVGGRHGLISVEDVTPIRAKASPQAAPPTHGPLYSLEPLGGITTEKGAQQGQGGHRWSGPAAVGGRERRDRHGR